MEGILEIKNRNFSSGVFNFFFPQKPFYRAVWGVAPDFSKTFKGPGVFKVFKGPNVPPWLYKYRFRGFLNVQKFFSPKPGVKGGLLKKGENLG